MKTGSTMFLRLALVGMGVAAGALCIFAFPSLWRGVPEESVAIQGALYGILACLYVAAVPFFIALNQAWRLLGYIDRKKAFSIASVVSLRRISRCGLSISAIFAVMEFFLYSWAQFDDAPGLIVIGMVLSGAALAVAAFAGVVQHLLLDVIKMKKENELTV